MGRIGPLFFLFEYFYDYKYDNCLYTDGSYVHKKEQSGIMVSKKNKESCDKNLNLKKWKK